MTVAELRKALEGVPDDILVAAYDEGVLGTEDVSAGVELVARHPYRMYVVWEHSRHTPEEIAKGVKMFVVS